MCGTKQGKQEIERKTMMEDLLLFQNYWYFCELADWFHKKNNLDNSVWYVG